MCCVIESFSDVFGQGKGGGERCAWVCVRLIEVDDVSVSECVEFKCPS